jgi:hypothetical protein
MDHIAAQRGFFPAPWGIEVKIMTIGGSAICLGLPLYLSHGLPEQASAFSNGLLQAPAIVWLLCFLYSIRGYSIRPDCLLIHRLVWSTRIPLVGLKSIDTGVAPFQRTIRIFGNPGIFGICGFFYNQRIGRFNAFVTDKRNALVLRFEGRTIALSPGDARRFLTTLLEATDGCRPVA